MGEPGIERGVEEPEPRIVWELLEGGMGGGDLIDDRAEDGVLNPEDVELGRLGS